MSLEVSRQPLKGTKCEAGSRPTAIKGYQNNNNVNLEVPNVRLEVSRQPLKGTKCEDGSGPESGLGFLVNEFFFHGADTVESINTA